MKMFRSLAAALLTWMSAAPAFAVPVPPATVNFFSEQGLVFRLVLDGQPITSPVARQVHLVQLIPGRHWADFSVPSAYGPPMRFRTTVWLEPGLETSYALVIRPGYGPQLRQVGSVVLGQPAYGPGGNYGGSYPPPPQAGNPYPYGNGPGSYDNNPDGTGPGGYPGPAPYGNTPGGYQQGNPIPAPGYPGGYGTSPAPTPADPGRYEPGTAPAPAPDGYDPTTANGNNLAPLAPAEVQELTQELRNRPSDAERLRVAEEALAQGSVRADELAQLLGTLSFDKARIALAEYGYAHVTDPQNFNWVYGMFRLPSSVQEVQQALGLSRGN